MLMIILVIMSQVFLVVTHMQRCYLYSGMIQFYILLQYCIITHKFASGSVLHWRDFCTIHEKWSTDRKDDHIFGYVCELSTFSWKHTHTPHTHTILTHTPTLPRAHARAQIHVRTNARMRSTPTYAHKPAGTYTQVEKNIYPGVEIRAQSEESKNNQGTDTDMYKACTCLPLSPVCVFCFLRFSISTTRSSKSSTRFENIVSGS